MIRVRNRGTVLRIARTTYKANRKRNLLTILAIILTVFLITGVVNTGISYWQFLTERELYMSGIDYDIGLTEPRQEQADRLKKLDQVEAVGLLVKCAIVTKGNGQYASMVRLYYGDSSCWEEQCRPAFQEFTGDYPKEEGELVLSSSALKELGIEKPRLGMKIPMTYYPTSDSSEDNGVYQKEFTLCGYFKDYTGESRGFVSQAFYQASGVSQESYGMGTLCISMKSPLYTKEDVKAIEKAVKLEDRQILMADTEQTTGFLKMALGLAGLLLMIAISGFLFIYNTMYIAVSKDIRYYGQLKTIGMTSRQLRGVVYRQALYHSCIGIPLGLAAGLGVSAGLMPTILKFLGVSAVQNQSFYLPVGLVAAAFSAVVVFVSSRRPAVMAGECSLIEAMRYIPKGSQRRKSENGLRAMARRNMFRDKKQGVIIIASFTLAVTLFLAVNILLRGYDTKRVLNESFSSDIQIENETVMEEDLPLITEEKLQKLKEIPGVKQVRSVGSAEISMPYQEEVFGGYYKRLFQSRLTPGGDYEETIEKYKKDSETEHNLFGSRLIAVDEEEFRVLNEELGNVLDEEEFQAGEIALAGTNYWCSPEEAVGKTAEFYFPGEEERHSVKIAALAYSPAIYSGGYSPELIVSMEFAEKLLGEVCTEVVYVDYQEAFSQETEEAVKEIFQGEERIRFQSKLDSYKNMRETEEQLQVLGRGIGILVGFLALMNYVNMMAAKIQNRAREFAALESLGMTRSQMRRILAREGLGYGGISILLSLFFGIPLGYILYQGMNVYGVGFSIPVLNNLALFLLVLFICAGAPPFLYSLSQKGSLIERMRKNQ